MRSTILTLIFVAFALFSQAQNYLNEEKTNSGPVILFHLTYAQQLPGGDLKDRFGSNLDVGGGFEFISSKGNFILGVEGDYMFGSKVKENVLTTLQDENGLVLAANNFATPVLLRQRGFYAGGFAGKLFGLSKDNKRSGIRITVGAGLLQHKIRIQDNPQGPIPQLAGEYKKGYDRLSNGLAFKQFIGYQLLSKNHRINFFAGFEFTQAFTQNRRSLNFDTRVQDLTKRTDLVYGFRLGWSLPIYLDFDPEKIYY